MTVTKCPKSEEYWAPDAQKRANTERKGDQTWAKRARNDGKSGPRQRNIGHKAPRKGQKGNEKGPNVGKTYSGRIRFAGIVGLLSPPEVFIGTLKD